MRQLAELCDEHYHLLLALLIAALALGAWANRFVLDDAFISFRYARNLALGHGLVWNPGEPVEGYTNFLWTLLLAIPIAAGIDPVAFCQALGPLLFAATLALTAGAARRLLASRPLALVGVLLLGTNHTFSAYATGGLETQLVACLLVAVVGRALAALDEDRLGGRRALGLSLLGAAAVLTRLDAVLVCGPAFVAAAQAARGSGRRRQLAWLLAPAGLVLGAWLAWKLSFYGSLLPNTFAAKTGSGGAWGRGLAYLGSFFASYWLVPFPLLAAWAVPRMWRARDAQPGLLLASLALTYLYIASVGGDFMEFRFVAHTLPLLVLLILWLVFRVVPGTPLRVALLALVLAGSLHHARTFRFERGIETIEGLAAHLHHPRNDWAGIGRALAAALPPDSGVTIATTTAGAIPYYARLPAVDMLGLMDPWIARHGLEIDALAGHTRIAPFRYLVERGVHLVLGQPWVRTGPDPERAAYRYDQLGRLYLLDARPALLPEEAAMVEIPLGEGRRAVALYLKPHPAVERAIADRGWRKVPLRRPAA